MTCGCHSPTRVHIRSNLASGVRRDTFRGREHLVVPVVMLKETVVNGGLVPAAQLKPEAWNGVPVTVNHPEALGQSVTANSPKTIEQWSVGTIFNSKLDGDKLKAEAWVDIELAEKNTPGLIDRLEAGEPMDVSTGYFPTVQTKSGTFNGKSYTEVHTELKPDHLALLPSDTGACSWQDGCGVRANRKGKNMPNAEDEEERRGLRALLSRLIGNVRGPDNDRRQIAADLVSDDRAPFTSDDLWVLLEMSSETLERLRQEYLVTVETNKGDAAVSDPKNKPGAAEAPVTHADLNSAFETLKSELKDLVTNAAGTAATSAIEKFQSDAKTAKLIGELVANTELGFTEEELKAMPASALEKLAVNSAKPKKTTPVAPTNFGGRGLRTHSDSGSQPATYGGMVNNGAAEKSGAKGKED